MGEKFVSKAMDEKGDWFDVWGVVQVGSGGTSGMGTDVSETFKHNKIQVFIAGSNPAEADGFVGRKNRQNAYLRRGSKAVVPMS